MKAKEFLISETLRATDSFFGAARRVPADKVDWKPLDLGRSVLDQARECAQSPTWGASVVKAGRFEWNQEMFEAARREREQWTTLDECEAVCKKNLAVLVSFIEGLDEAEFEKTIEIPFGKNPNWRVIDILHLHAWNATYHTGQVNYIQTLYGDTAMQ